MKPKYPTRMHEVLGVEPNEQFMVETRGKDRLFVVDHRGMLREKDGEGVYAPRGSILEDAILHGIIRKPKPNEDQIDILMALWTLGYRYIAMDSDWRIHAYFGLPKKDDGVWIGVTCARVHKTAIFDLVSWNDEKPLNIKQTLLDNGVEVGQ